MARPGLSRRAERKIASAFADLSDDNTSQVAAIPDESGPLAGASGPDGEQDLHQTEDEVVELAAVGLDQRVLEAAEPDREASVLAFVTEAIAKVKS